MEGKESEAGKQTGREWKQSELAVRLGVVQEFVLLQPGQVNADEGNQEDVGIQVAVQREAS